MLTSELLKSGTSSAHHRLEVQMRVKEIFNRTLTYAQYCELIQVNYIVAAAIEADIHQALTGALREELTIETRKKIPALEKDLDVLGLYKTVMHHPNKPGYANAVEALGGMYVLEGATLGGNVIARRLQEIPALQDQPFHFYKVYGEEIRNKWLQFIEVLNRETGEDAEACVAKANETFNFYFTIARNMMPQFIA